MRYGLLLLLVLFIGNGNAFHQDPSPGELVEIPADFSLNDFYSANASLDRAVDSVFEVLGDTQRVAQMIVTSMGRRGKPINVVEDLVQQQMVGGVILLSGDKEGYIRILDALDSLADSSGTLPLLYSLDAEPSLMKGRIKGAQPVPNTVTIRDNSHCREVAAAINKELIDIGVHHNYAPVCDVTPENKAIGNRSFGNNPDTVISRCLAFIEATQAEGIVATAKHFPGHGYVVGDTHEKLVYIDGEMRELPVYFPLIQAGVISIMVAHIAIKNNPDFNTNGAPATASRAIVTDLLKNEMGFKGLVITDAMNMGAISKVPNSTLKAARAGCDIILMPVDEIQGVHDILAEMQTDTLFKEQVYASVRKIIRLKVCLGLL